MPSYKTAFGSHLKTEDLQGRAVVVTIADAAIGEIKDGDATEKKLILTFAGKDKTLVLNKTRCAQLESIFMTDNYDLWRGPIMLVPGTTMYQGKPTGCINIASAHQGAPVAPVAPPPPPAPVTSDDIPF